MLFGRLSLTEIQGMSLRQIKNYGIAWRETIEWIFGAFGKGTGSGPVSGKDFAQAFNDLAKAEGLSPDALHQKIKADIMSGAWAKQKTLEP
jgi:hypothetical protein